MGRFTVTVEIFGFDQLRDVDALSIQSHAKCVSDERRYKKFGRHKTGNHLPDDRHYLPKASDLTQKRWESVGLSLVDVDSIREVKIGLEISIWVVGLNGADLNRLLADKVVHFSVVRQVEREHVVLKIGFVVAEEDFFDHADFGVHLVDKSIFKLGSHWLVKVCEVNVGGGTDAHHQVGVEEFLDGALVHARLLGALIQLKVKVRLLGAVEFATEKEVIRIHTIVLLHVVSAPQARLYTAEMIFLVALGEAYWGFGELDVLLDRQISSANCHLKDASWRLDVLPGADLYKPEGKIKYVFSSVEVSVFAHRLSDRVALPFVVLVRKERDHLDSTVAEDQYPNHNRYNAPEKCVELRFSTVVNRDPLPINVHRFQKLSTPSAIRHFILISFIR